MEEGGREDSSDNELSIMTKAELYNLTKSLVLRKYKCNDDNEASLIRLLQQFTHNGTTVYPEQSIIQRLPGSLIKTFNKDTIIEEEVKRFILKVKFVLTSVQIKTD